MAREDVKREKLGAKQVFLLKRWADLPQYSPLSPIPKDELWDLELDSEVEGQAAERLVRRQKARLIQDWFLENFELRVSAVSYDEYIWGGPFDVETILETHFSEELDEELKEMIVDELVIWNVSSSHYSDSSKLSV